MSSSQKRGGKGKSTTRTEPLTSRRKQRTAGGNSVSVRARTVFPIPSNRESDCVSEDSLDDVCVKCNVAVNDRCNHDVEECNGGCCEGVRCQSCNRWEHVGCAGVSDEEYNFIPSASSHFMWFCSYCRPGISMTLAKMRGIETRLDDIEKRQEKSENKIGEVDRKVERLERELEGRDEAMDEVIGMKVDKVFEEQEERSRRQNNLLVHNFGESNSEDPAIRKEHDKLGCVKIFRDHCMCVEIKDEDVENVVRIGERNMNSARPRMVKIMFRNQEVRRKVLKGGSALKNVEDQYIRNIYITPDYTPKQREEYNKLKRNLEERRARGERDLVIRRGKIVQSRPRGNVRNGMGRGGGGRGIGSVGEDGEHEGAVGIQQTGNGGGGNNQREL